MGVDHFETDEVHVMDTTSTRINPATQETLAAVLAAVDGLELSVDNIDIDMDDVETLLAATNAALASLEAANDVSGDDIVTALTTLQSALESDLTLLQASNETHSDEEQAAIASLETAVTAFKTAFDVRDLATETTLDALKTQHLNESNDTQARIGEISATPTVNTVMDRLKNIYEAVDDLELSIDNIDVDMDDVEALLTQLDVVLDDINDNKIGEEDASSVGSIIARLNDLQVNLAAFRSETNTNLNDIEASIDAFKAAFDARDLATETTLAAFSAANEASLTAIEADIEAQPTQAQQTADLQDIEDAVDELKAQNLTKHDSIITELQGVNTELDSLSASELWGFLKTGNAPTLDHIFKMEAPIATVYRYHGFATRGTATSAASWSIMRIEFTDIAKEEPIEFQVNEGMAWDDRVTGGTEGWS